jgi:hypothetical protein
MRELKNYTANLSIFAVARGHPKHIQEEVPTHYWKVGRISGCVKKLCVNQSCKLQRFCWSYLWPQVIKIWNFSPRFVVSHVFIFWQKKFLLIRRSMRVLSPKMSKANAVFMPSPNPQSSSLPFFWFPCLFGFIRLCSWMGPISRFQRLLDLQKTATYCYFLVNKQIALQKYLITGQ